MQLSVLITVLLPLVAVFNTGDAAITAWTEPAFTGADGSAAATTTVAENIVGSILVTIATTSAGTVTFVIDSQDTTGKLAIDATTGVLSLASGYSFDYETSSTYKLVIVGTDGGDSIKGTATVTLSITNVGPTIVSQFVTAVPDLSGADTEVISLTSTGADSFAITAGNTHTHFKIASTGVITVNTATTLGASALGGYALTVTATDTSAAVDTSTVWIAVMTCSSGNGLHIASILAVFVFTILGIVLQ